MSGNGDSEDRPRRTPVETGSAGYERTKQGPLITFSARGIEIAAAEAHPDFGIALVSWEKVMEMAERFRER
jgi:hypothetical protein